MDLYNLIPLIANANRTGMKIIFWSNIDDRINFVPALAPNVAIIQDILYPNVKPRNPISAYTPNIPITVSPANHKHAAILKLFLIELIKSLV